jgi:hypothetical protein
VLEAVDDRPDRFGVAGVVSVAYAGDPPSRLTRSCRRSTSLTHRLRLRFASGEPRGAACVRCVSQARRALPVVCVACHPAAAQSEGRVPAVEIESSTC